MFETFINWVEENFGESSKYVPVEYRTEDLVAFSDMDYDEVSPYDAMSCASCPGDNTDNSVPPGKQAI